MSWINDVRADLRQLDTSVKTLRRFGILVGGVLLGFTLGALILHGSLSIPMWVVGVLGALLVGSALIRPNSLKVVQRYWMGFAFAIGWLVSRVILIVLFYGIVTPIGLVARLTGKKFLDIRFRDGGKSYWVQKNKMDDADYERMF
jgi:hypothetical protein